VRGGVICFESNFPTASQSEWFELDYRFDVADPFPVRAICLVDHGGISLCVAHEPADARFESVSRAFEVASATLGHEAKRQLRDLATMSTDGMHDT
jgi:hypothetical protein